MDSKNVALVLPLFHEYARRIRQGVLEWVDRHPGWRVIEIDSHEAIAMDRLERHLHGVITWFMGMPSDKSLAAFDRLPMVDCGLGERLPTRANGPARVTFDRSTINQLAVGHFRDLGLEVAGYVGYGLRDSGKLVPRVANMRDAAISAGMEWTSFDLGEPNPSMDPAWIWEGHRIGALVRILSDAPKPLGLLAQEDYVGVMLCEAARNLGISIPEEIAILGQGNRVIGQTGSLPLSSVILPGHEIGMRAAEVLDAWMKGISPKPRQQFLPCHELAVRRSTGGLSLDLGIERAKRHFDRHAVSGITVQELATIAGCTPKTLRTRFSAWYGFELSQEIRERRTREALKLLAGSDLEIGEIGRRCGFPSAPNFFNFIARQTGGIGPADYRRSQRS